MAKRERKLLWTDDPDLLMLIGKPIDNELLIFDGVERGFKKSGIFAKKTQPDYHPTENPGGNTLVDLPLYGEGESFNIDVREDMDNPNSARTLFAISKGSRLTVHNGSSLDLTKGAGFSMHGTTAENPTTNGYVGKPYFNMTGKPSAVLHDNANLVMDWDSILALHGNASIKHSGNSKSKMHDNSEHIMNGGSRVHYHDYISVMGSGNQYRIQGNQSDTSPAATSYIFEIAERAKQYLQNDSFFQMTGRSHKEMHGDSVIVLRDEIGDYPLPTPVPGSPFVCMLGGGKFIMKPSGNDDIFNEIRKEDGNPFFGMYDNSRIVLADNSYLKLNQDAYIRASENACMNLTNDAQVRVSDSGYIGVHQNGSILLTDVSKIQLNQNAFIHLTGNSAQYMYGMSDLLMKNSSLEMATVFDTEHYNAMRNTSGKAFLGLIGPVKVTAVQKVGSGGPGGIGPGDPNHEDNGLFIQDKKVATQEWAENLLTAGINGINPATIGAATRDWVLTAFSVFNISTLGIPHGVSNSNSDNIAKTVSMPGLLPDANVPNGLVIGVRFANGHNAVQEQVTLNINAGGSVGYIGGKTLWNEKGRIGTVGNVEVLQDSTRFQIFRWDASVNRFIWLMAVSS